MRQTKRPILIVILTLFIAGSCTYRARGQKNERSAPPKKDKVPTLTVCEALAKPLEYDGKIVQIRDRVVGTDEATTFISDSCPGVLVTDGKVWPSSIVWTMPEKLDFIIHPVNFTFDWSSQKRLKEKWERVRGQVPDKCFALSYTGMFEVWSKSKARRPIPGGWTEFDGFGHLNGWGAQLVLMSADD